MSNEANLKYTPPLPLMPVVCPYCGASNLFREAKDDQETRQVCLTCGNLVTREPRIRLDYLEKRERLVRQMQREKRHEKTRRWVYIGLGILAILYIILYTFYLPIAPVIGPSPGG